MAMQRYKFVKNTIGNDQRHKAFSTCFKMPYVFGEAGTGKSIFQKNALIESDKSQDAKMDVIPDYIGEYKKLMEALAGTEIKNH